MSDLKVSQIHGEAIGEEGKKTRLEGRPCCSDEITIQQLRNKYKEEALDIKRKIHQRGQSSISRLEKIIKDASDLTHILDYGDIHSPTKPKSIKYSQSAADSTQRSESSTGLVPTEKYFRNPSKKRKSNNL